MDTKFPVILTLSIGLAVLIFQMSGAGALIDHSSDREFKSGELLEGQANSSNVGNDSAYKGDIQADSDSNIVGVILGSIPRMLSLLAIPGILGSELQTLTPAPYYVAQPIGFLFNIIVYIGGFQVVTGRLYE